MQIDILIIIYIICSRIFELCLSSRNVKILKKEGAEEFYSQHYKFLVLFHLIFVIYFLKKSLVFEDIQFLYLFLFFLVQIVRYKIIFDLGKYWTTRIYVLKKVPLVKKGMYRYINHPNYLVVFFEVLLVCLIFQDYLALLYFSNINLVLIFIRIYFEEKANRSRRTLK